MTSKTSLLYMVIYTGPAFDKRAVILRTFPSREETFSWLAEIAKKNGVSEKRLSTDADLFEIMEDYYQISVQFWGFVKANPDNFGDWEATSLKALVSHDFSSLDEKRWELLSKRIVFPTVEAPEEGEEEDSAE